MQKIKKTPFRTLNLEKFQVLSAVLLIESILLPFQALFLSKCLDSMGFIVHRKDMHQFFGPTMGAVNYPIFDSIQEVAQIIALIMFLVSIFCIFLTIMLRCLFLIQRKRKSGTPPVVVFVSIIVVVLVLMAAITAVTSNLYHDYDSYLYYFSESLDWNRIPRIQVNPENPRCHDIFYNPCKPE